ncbi:MULTISPECIES: ABC transporter ATP-binding protein [Paenibacillus]|uniref:ABC transporter ATP-binding protein n=1 Tax=Paenibacillus TaxID=44249 RepID=UPI00088BD134|nr:MULTISPECIES: ABC transporter ATP-binding protein [Paenibacillus]NTZ18112.1 ABC transporter ATP-binding protein [Paenibacillus sp. JMULE4]GCL73019.1 ABC transporter ATP-binding protein [Paenibacillus naphthalenovorans]SDI69941.1 NitT/TauT family transport system ATP-binding protein [Paenibacillus naphthalenovorans]
MQLAVQNVEKGYEGRRVLKNVTFDVDSHEFICILGHSGCGKSTLLNLIAGFLQPDSGSVTVNGVPVKGPSKSRGVVFQDHALFPWYKVIDNIAFGPEVQGKSKAEAREIAHKYLKLVGLEDYAEHLPDQLSGGMKQRVGIARALASGPDILLMDEPFGALDVLTREMMQKELLRIWLELRPSVLFITHSLSEAVYLADRIMVMKDGDVAGEFRVTMDRPRSNQHPEFIGLMREIQKLLTDE